ncbi:MAG: sigma-70 family RNA polymerase sigma factor [Phycisphaerae bacterium]|nr:sigma-70 family RNA polymerase sigma factor [Phycisphaerae bacterium]
MAREDVADFNAVFETHFADIYGYLAFRLAPRIEDARDLTQDVFVAGLKGWKTFRGESTPLQWLRAIARRKVADYFQRNSESISVEAILPSCQAGPDSPAVERTERLAVVMRSITAESRELLEEKYIDGISVREMARRRGKTEKAIESALGRARAAVREKYGQVQARMGESS